MKQIVSIASNIMANNQLVEVIIITTEKEYKLIENEAVPYPICETNRYFLSKNTLSELISSLEQIKCNLV